MSQPEQKLGDRLRQARENAKLSRKKVADELGYSEQQQGQWETNSREPKVEYLAKLAKLYGVSTDYLIFGTTSNEATDRKSSRDMCREFLWDVINLGLKFDYVYYPFDKLSEDEQNVVLANPSDMNTPDSVYLPALIFKTEWSMWDGVLVNALNEMENISIADNALRRYGMEHNIISQVLNAAYKECIEKHVKDVPPF